MKRKLVSSINYRVSDIVSIFLIFLFVFFIESRIAVNWEAYGVFDEYNVIFDTDSNQWKVIFANGWAVGGFNHPLLAYYFSIPIRIYVDLASFFGFVDNEIADREALAIYVAPMCAALKAVCLYISFRLLSLGAFQACLPTMIGAFSFSAVIFGATPSSYAVTGLGLSLITLFALLAYRQNDVLSHIGFVIFGVFTTGTTVTNIIHVGWMRWSLLVAKDFAPLIALARAVLFAVVILITTLSINFVLSEMRGVEKNSSNLIISGDFIETYRSGPKRQIENILRFPEILARTVLPTIPKCKDNILAIKNDNPIKFELTYDIITFNSVSIMLSAVAFLVFGGGAIIAYCQGGAWRWFALASAASVLTYGILYTWFGTNVFLYSQHWQVPCVILVGSWSRCSFFESIYGKLLMIALLVLLLIGDFHVMQLITEWIVEGLRNGDDKMPGCSRSFSYFGQLVGQ